MTKGKWILSICAALVVVASVSAIFYTRYLTNNIDCISIVVLHNDSNSDRINLIYSRKMSKGQGIDTLAGTLYHNNVPEGRIDRSIRYSYEAQGEKYIMTAKSIFKTTHDDISDAQLSRNLSDMYLRPGGKNMVILKNVGQAGWLAFQTPTPLYFCKRNN